MTSLAIAEILSTCAAFVLLGGVSYWYKYGKKRDKAERKEMKEKFEKSVTLHNPEYIIYERYDKIVRGGTAMRAVPLFVAMQMRK